MIEILKEGKLPLTGSFFGTCSNCHCEIKANYEDHSANWIPANRFNSLIKVKCPTPDCDHVITCKRKKQV